MAKMLHFASGTVSKNSEGKERFKGRPMRRGQYHAIRWQYVKRELPGRFLADKSNTVSLRIEVPDAFGEEEVEALLRKLKELAPSLHRRKG